MRRYGGPVTFPLLPVTRTQLRWLRDAVARVRGVRRRDVRIVLRLDHVDDEIDYTQMGLRIRVKGQRWWYFGHPKWDSKGVVKAVRTMFLQGDFA